VFNKKTIISIVVLICVALVVGNSFGRLFAKTFPNLTGDPDGFNKAAKQFAVHGDLGGSIRLAPAFPVFIGLIYRIFGESHNNYVFFQSLLLGILACLVYLISLESFQSQEIALLTGFIIIIFPICLWYVPRHWVELLFANLVILMLWSASKVLAKGTILNLLVFGIATALTSLCKSVVMLFPLFLAFSVLLMRVFRIKPFEKLDKGRMVRIFLIPTAAMIVVLSPWTIRNYNVSGKFVPVSSNASVEFFRGNVMAENNSFLPQNTISEIWGEIMDREQEIFREHGLENPSPIEREEIFNPIMKDFILKSPFKFALKIVKQIPAFWINGETTSKSLVFLAMALPTLLLSIIGYILTRKELIFANVAMIFLAYFNLIYAAVLAFARYSMPVYPPILILAVYAVFLICSKRNRTIYKKRAVKTPA